MLKKNGVLLSFFAGSLFLTAVATAEEVALIRAEDEDLLQGIVIEDEQTEESVTVEQQSDNVFYPEVQEEAPVLLQDQQEWFDPNLLPTNRARATAQNKNAGKRAYRDAINACMDELKERLYMERDLFDSGIKYSVAYLSQTMAEINQCYENVGHQIIEQYYGGDKTTMRTFDKKAAGFYINGTDVNFNPQFCGENCSMSNVLDAQMQKFAEFRTYLYQLLDNGVGGR